MRNDHGRATVLVRAAACALVAFGIASPAAAQFGGLKKKLKAAAGAESAADGQKGAGAPAAGTGAPAAPAGNAARGGAVVLTPQMVDQLIAGLKAGEAYRQDARKADTPYGRYNRAAAAYEAAKPKCDAAHTAFINRMANDEKLATQYSGLLDKAMAAQGKGDTKAAMDYQYQALALQDPSCAVRQPDRPDNLYDAERDIDAKAEEAAVKGSGLSAGEYAMAMERGTGILSNNPPPDASASEKSAVNAKAAELKSLMGIKDQSTERAMKPAPAPQAAPTQADTAPTMPPGTSDMTNCMAKNAKKHEKEIEALGERAKAAQEAGDMAATLAIADTLRVLQTAGCNMGQ